MELFKLYRKQMWLVALPAFIGILLIWVTPTVAYAQEIVHFKTSQYVVEPYGSTDVTIELVSENALVAAVTIDLEYDPTVVTQTGCILESFSGICNELIAGKMRMAGVSTSGVDGNRPIATIQFDPIGSSGDVSPLTMAVLTLVDVSATPLEHSISNGVIQLRQSVTTQGSGTQSNVYLPVIGRNNFKDIEGELTPTQSIMRWLCALMQNFGWTSDACYITL